MGLANLVPGISGGTMLLAAGIYPSFVESLANVTRFKFSTRSIVVLGSVGVAALLAILLFAGTLKELVVEHRWVMYSLFIGLTLGGVPLVWRLTEQGQRATAALILPGLLSFAAMIGLAFIEAGNEVNDQSSGFAMLFFAGLAGASAMILPGLSGGYLLLLMRQYVPILSAVDSFKEALKARDFSAAMEPGPSSFTPCWNWSRRRNRRRWQFAEVDVCQISNPNAGDFVGLAHRFGRWSLPLQRICRAPSRRCDQGRASNGREY